MWTFAGSVRGRGIPGRKNITGRGRGQESPSTFDKLSVVQCGCEERGAMRLRR